MTHNLQPLKRHSKLSTALLVLAVALSASMPALASGPSLADKLPGEADAAVRIDVAGLVGALDPAVVSNVVGRFAGRFMSAGMPDPSRDIEEIALAANVTGLKDSQVTAVVRGKLDSASLVKLLQESIPGEPEVRVWMHRGLKVESLEASGRPALSVAALADGECLLAQHPAGDDATIGKAAAALGDSTRSYPAMHAGALPSEALIALHVADPKALSSLPKMDKAPLGHVTEARLEVRRLGNDRFRLDVRVELTGWLKAKIVRPFIASALQKAGANPKVPAGARALLSRMELQGEGKALFTSVEASAEEIEQLLLSLPEKRRAEAA